MSKKVVIAGALGFFLVGVIGANFLTTLLTQQQSEAPQEQATLIGTPLPQFSLLAVDGVRENINQWQGKVQIINFWATWCPPCKREIPILIDLQKQYANDGLQVIGIALDQKEPVRDYVENSKINYPILVGQDDVVDVSIELGNEQGVLPYTVIVDQGGLIQYVRYGEISKESIEGEILKLMNPASAAGSGS